MEKRYGTSGRPLEGTSTLQKLIQFVDDQLEKCTEAKKAEQLRLAKKTIGEMAKDPIKAEALVKYVIASQHQAAMSKAKNSFENSIKKAEADNGKMWAEVTLSRHIPAESFVEARTVIQPAIGAAVNAYAKKYPVDKEANSTVTVLPVRLSPVGWELPRGVVPVINPGLLVAAQDPTHFFRDPTGARWVPLQQPREHLAQLRHRQRRDFFSPTG